MMAIVVNGDACKPEDLERAFAAIDGVDAVVSTIGGTTADPSADSQASVSAAKAGLASLGGAYPVGCSYRAPPARLPPYVNLDTCNLPLQGNINLIEAAVKHGVKKFVLVTSIGTG